MINIIVALTRKNAAIGNAGKLLFHVTDDLKRFKKLTMGHPIIMGRKTYESISKALPGRTNIVITRNSDYQAPDSIVVRSLEDAFEEAKKHDNQIFVIGGGEIYKQALPHADKLYLTIFENNKAGDVFFPDWKKDFTIETFHESHFDKETGLKYLWIDVERINNTSKKTSEEVS